MKIKQFVKIIWRIYTSKEKLYQTYLIKKAFIHRQSQMSPKIFLN